MCSSGHEAIWRTPTYSLIPMRRHGGKFADAGDPLPIEFHQIRRQFSSKQIADVRCDSGGMIMAVALQQSTFVELARGI